MTAEEAKARIAERRQRIATDPNERQLELANEQSFFNGVVSELARVRAGEPFTPHGACGDKVTRFVEEAYRAMTDFFHATDSSGTPLAPE